MRHRSLAAAGAALINASVWGLSWLPLKWLEAHGVASLWATWLIFAMCSLAVCLVHPAAPRLLWQHRRALGTLLFASGLTNACFNAALASGDVVRSVLLFYLMPMWVVLLARWLLGERVTLAAVVRVALALSGAALVLGEGRVGWPIPERVADWLAVAGGFCFGLNNVMLRKHAATPEAARALAMFAGAALVAPLAIAALAVAGTLPALRPDGSAWLVLGLFTVAVLLGNVALQYGAARLPANVLSVLMLFEILVATLSAWLGGVATVSGSTLLGGALIVGASVLALVRPGQPE
ncbi:MAG: DMT family transporter [Burkholderiales bacterium]|nr:DMT family transporter [Burkholderiales bacterium]